VTHIDVGASLRSVAAHALVGSLAPTPGRPLYPTEWRDLLVRVRRERIAPLLADAIMNGSFPASDAQATEVLELEAHALAKVLTLEATLVQVADVLAGVSIPFRVLKGPAVAHLDYPDPSLRDFGDIDLLIHPNDLDRVITMLAEHGYVRRFPEPRSGFDRRFARSISVVNRNGLELDLHRTIAGGVFGLRVKVQMLWHTPPAEFVLGGINFGALGASERFMHACYHATLGNVPPRLVPQRDIAQMLLHGSVDPNEIRTIAAEWQGEAVVAHAIRTTWATLMLTDVVALSVWASNFVPEARQRRELARATSPNYSYAAQALDSVRAIRPVRDRLVYASALTFPRRGYIDGRHFGFTSRFGHAISELFAARSTGQQVGHQSTDAISRHHDPRGEP
jgi:hypothetical protein